MRSGIGQRRTLHTFECAAGAHHHGSERQVTAWRRKAATLSSAEANKKAEAHDDYMEAMRLFRQRMPEFGPDTAAIDGPRGPQTMFEEGYRRAVKDMDRALLDVMRMKEDPS